MARKREKEREIYAMNERKRKADRWKTRGKRWWRRRRDGEGKGERRKQGKHGGFGERDKQKGSERKESRARAGWFSCCEDNLGQARLKIFIKLHARSTYDRFDSH